VLSRLFFSLLGTAPFDNRIKPASELGAQLACGSAGIGEADLRKAAQGHFVCLAVK
jgi:hypothetical protein